MAEHTPQGTTMLIPEPMKIMISGGIHRLMREYEARHAAAIQAERDRHAAEVVRVRRDDLEFAANQMCQYCAIGMTLYTPDANYSHYTHKVLLTDNHNGEKINAREGRIICFSEILHAMIADMQPGGWREYKEAAHVDA